MTTDLLALWHRALASEFGLELTIDNENIITDLYAARKAAADPRLDALRVTKMQDGTLWIVKRELRMEEDDGPALT